MLDQIAGCRMHLNLAFSPRIRLNKSNHTSSFRQFRSQKLVRISLVCTAQADQGPVNKSPFDAGFKWGKWRKPENVGYDGPGADISWQMNVDFETAVLGGETELEYESQITCEGCGGEGILKSTTIQCSKCKGKGRQRTPRKINVKIPAGVVDGANIRVKGQGDNGNPPGNLLIRANVPEWNATFRRSGDDLYSDAFVLADELKEGGSVEVTTIDGTSGNLKFPADTKEGAYLRIKGRGAPVKVGSLEERGDQFVRLVVKDS